MRKMKLRLKTKVWALLACLMLSFLTACTSEEVYEAAGIALEVADALLQEEKQEADYRAETPETEFENLELVEDAAQDSEEDSAVEPENLQEQAKEVKISEDGTYTSKDEVALYIHLYDHLPDNYITKKDARALGWEGGTPERYLEGSAIGGDSFGNREGLLPEGEYTECDLYTLGKAERGAERLVFSEDEYYYTGDHYASFTQVWVEDGEVIIK